MASLATAGTTAKRPGNKLGHGWDCLTKARTMARRTGDGLGGKLGNTAGELGKQLTAMAS